MSVDLFYFYFLTIKYVKGTTNILFLDNHWMAHLVT